MKVSVIIPTYNEENYISNCLKSLENQLEKADEVIVVDNECTDRTVTIAKKFKVRIIKETKQGIIHARNRGFDEAKYEIIARCDADTILPPDWIKKIKSNFKKQDIDALTGPAYFYDLIPTNKKLDFVSPVFLKPSKIVRGHHVLYGPNMAITKRSWLKVRDKVCQEDSEVHEDMDLAIHINPYGKIKYDASLIVGTSARRFKHDPAMIIEYPLRWIKTLKNHRNV